MPTTEDYLDRLSEQDYDCVQKYQVRQTDGINRYKIAIKVEDELPNELKYLLSDEAIQVLSGSLDGTLVLHLIADVTYDGVDISVSVDD